MDRLTCMRAFVAVAEAGGFSRAARREGRSKTLLSKYVLQLEQQLGVRLLNRTTRQVSLTTLGQAYLERCRPLLDELQELEAQVREVQGSAKGRLRIQAPISFAELMLMRPLHAFHQRYPEVALEIDLSDRLTDLVEEGVDVAIRIAHLSDSSLVARPLALIPVISCAAPDYFSRRGMPQTPAALAQHDCILDSNLSEPRRWDYQQQGQIQAVQVGGAMQVNSARAVRELALAGAGIARCPLFVVAEDLAQGRLRPCLQAYAAEPLGLYAVYAHRRYLAAKVRLLIEHLAEHFALGPVGTWSLART